MRAAEGSGGEVNAVGTAVRALVEAPVGFEKALEGIGCGAGDVGRGRGVGGEHVGRGAGGVGRRESGGGEHRAEWGDEGEEKRRSGAAASARGAAAGGSGVCLSAGDGAGAGSEEQQHEHHGQGVEVEGLAVAQSDGNHRGAIEAEGAGFEIGREQRGRGAVAGRRVGLPVDGGGGIDGGRRRGGRRGVRVLVGREEALTETAPEVEAEADDEGEFEEVEHEHEGFAEQVVELLEEVEHGVWNDEGGETWGNWGICGFAVGARRFALRVAWCGFGGRALPGGRRRSRLAGWALVAAPWGCFDGAKVRFCSKENGFFGILHDEKAADCGGVLQACGREPKASASLQPGGLRPSPDGGASLGAGGAPLPVATRSHAPSPTTCGDGSGSEETGSEREREWALRRRQWR